MPCSPLVIAQQRFELINDAKDPLRLSIRGGGIRRVYIESKIGPHRGVHSREELFRGQARREGPGPAPPASVDYKYASIYRYASILAAIASSSVIRRFCRYARFAMCAAIADL